MNHGASWLQGKMNRLFAQSQRIQRQRFTLVAFFAALAWAVYGQYRSGTELVILVAITASGAALIPSFPLRNSLLSMLAILGVFIIVAPFGFILVRNATANEGPTDAQLRPTFFPARTYYRCVTPRDCEEADHVTFNSTVNLSKWGDERYFLCINNKFGNPCGYDLTVKPGQTINARMFFANNADKTVTGNADSTAHNTKLQLILSDTPSKEQLLIAELSASNATPKLVGATTVIRSSKHVWLSFESGLLYNNYFPKGRAIDSRLVRDGLPIGARTQDGNLAATYYDSGFIIAKLEVHDGPIPVYGLTTGH